MRLCRGGEEEAVEDDKRQQPSHIGHPCFKESLPPVPENWRGASDVPEQAEEQGLAVSPLLVAAHTHTHALSAQFSGNAAAAAR